LEGTDDEEAAFLDFGDYVEDGDASEDLF